jgi:hypothetical protein
MQSPLAPQKARSVSEATQRPSQATCPVGQDSTQRPAVQVSPERQTRPAFMPAQSMDEPQKLRSVLGSTQRPMQFTCPVGQDTWQRPSAHTCPAPQVIPAAMAVQSPLAPQKRGSFVGSTQRPMQVTCPSGHEVWQRPMAHTCPGPQAEPHMPQCARSVCRSRQLPMQSARPAPQEVTQVPIEHTWPPMQVLSHRPQWFLSVERSRHEPPHTICPTGHEV